MAQVTFTTEFGTEIKISNIYSSSSFEILKGAVALIEGLELAENNGTAVDSLYNGITTDIGSTSGLILTSRPNDVRLVTAEELNRFEEVVGSLGDYCDDVYCPEHGYQQGVSAETTLRDSGDDVDEVVELIEKSYADLDAMILEFVENIPNNLQEALPEIEAFGIEVRDYAAHLGEGNPAGSVLDALGAGIQLGAVWAGLSEGLATPQIATAYFKQNQAA